MEAQSAPSTPYPRTTRRLFVEHLVATPLHRQSTKKYQNQNFGKMLVFNEMDRLKY